MNRRLTALLFVLALTASACAREEPTEPGETGEPAQGAQTFNVRLDGEGEEGMSVAMTAFLPGELSAHPGDSVNFELPHFSGEPHTVALGTLVDAAVNKLKSLGPPPADATLLQLATATEELPEMKKLPDPFPHDLTGKAGPPDANQSAAAPCFMDEGEPAVSETGNAPACPERAQPDFNGKQTMYNSGMLTEEGASFNVALAEDLAPGEYGFMCLVHRAGMFGTLKVAAKGESIPSSKEVAEAGKKAHETRLAALKAAAAGVQATADKGLAGAFAREAPDSLVTEFFPKEVSVPTGGSAKWDLALFHAVSFDTPEDAVGVFVKGPDGKWHLNPKAGAPQNMPPPPEGFQFFPPRATGPFTVKATYDGSKFTSSGVQGSLPPAVLSYEVKFTKAGTYELRCLVHPDMKASVKVG